MPSCLVGAYAPDSARTVDEARERSRRAAELDPSVRRVRTTFLAGAETILHLFEAPSAETLDRVRRLPELPYQPIVEAVEGQELAE